MSQYLRVQWIRTVVAFDERRLEAVGGIDADGRPWTQSHDEAIAAVRSGECRLFLEQDGNVIWMTVGLHDDGSLRLRTVNDTSNRTPIFDLPDAGPRPARPRDVFSKDAAR